MLAMDILGQVAARASMEDIDQQRQIGSEFETYFLASRRWLPKGMGRESCDEMAALRGDHALTGGDTKGLGRKWLADTVAIRGQYSDSVLSELESQNDEQVEGMSARVRALKDVRKSLLF